MIRAYEVPHLANTGKVEHIKEIIALQQENLLVVCEWLSNHYREHGQIPQWLPAEVGLLCDTSMRQKDAYNQVRTVFRSWDAGLRTQGRELIKSMNVEDETLIKELYAINKHGLWLHPEKIKRMTISPLARDLSRAVFEQLLTENTMPLVGITPTVSFCQANSIYYRPAKRAKIGHWISLQSRVAGKPIYIPIEESEYFTGAGGRGNGTITLQVCDDGSLRVLLTRTLPDPAVLDRSGTLALDWGFTSMFATSDGRLLGRRTHDWLVARDGELQSLEAQLHRLRVPLKKSRRWRRLTHRVRAYVANEVGRILNTIADEKWEELVVEALDFRGKGFSRRMNRILQRAGRAAVRRKLVSLEERGVIVTRVNAAYTSQECDRCHYVAKDNRNDAHFVCGHCGHTANADIKGARTIRSRRSRPNGWLRVSRKAIFEMLEREFEARQGFAFASVLERSRRPGYRATSDEVGKTTGAGRPVAKLATGEPRSHLS